MIYRASLAVLSVCMVSDAAAATFLANNPRHHLTHSRCDMDRHLCKINTWKRTQAYIADSTDENRAACEDEINNADVRCEKCVAKIVPAALQMLKDSSFFSLDPKVQVRLFIYGMQSNSELADRVSKVMLLDHEEFHKVGFRRPSRPPLYEAIWGGSVSCLRNLLARGASIHLDGKDHMAFEFMIYTLAQVKNEPALRARQFECLPTVLNACAADIPDDRVVRIIEKYCDKWRLSKEMRQVFELVADAGILAVPHHWSAIMDEVLPDIVFLKRLSEQLQASGKKETSPLLPAATKEFSSIEWQLVSAPDEPEKCAIKNPFQIVLEKIQARNNSSLHAACVAGYGFDTIHALLQQEEFQKKMRTIELDVNNLSAVVSTPRIAAWLQSDDVDMHAVNAAGYAPEDYLKARMVLADKQRVRVSVAPKPASERGRRCVAHLPGGTTIGDVKRLLAEHLSRKGEYVLPEQFELERSPGVRAGDHEVVGLQPRLRLVVK